MKKVNKLLASIGAITVLTAPMTTVLMTATSCSKKNYAELVSEMKDDCIQTFLSICRNTHRNLWNEGEGYQYIKKQMQTMGFTEPSGWDDWSQLNAVKRMRAIELSPIEEFRGEYGNIWYDLPATPGLENEPKLMLQCHMDSQMAFSSDDEYKRWAKDPADKEEEGGCVIPYFNNNDEYMIAKDHKTSLGADGGVGMAVLLTIAKYRNSFSHPGIRLLFSAGESEACPEYNDIEQEIHLPEYAAGFSLLYYDQLRQTPKGETPGKEFWHGTKPFGEDGEYKSIISASGVIKNSIFVSSSGIHECSLHTPATLADSNKLNDDIATMEKPNDRTGNVIDWDDTKILPWSEPTKAEPKRWVKFYINGFEGGTSSTYISKGQGSAVSLLYKILFSGDTELQLIKSSSTPDNAYAISTTASADVATHYSADIWNLKIKSMLPSLKVSWPNEDWNNITIEAKEVTDPTALRERPKHAMSKKQSRDFIRMVAKELYFGPINWFSNGDVKTSQNFGPIDLTIHEGNETGKTSFELNCHIVERSSETTQLDIFKELTHSIIADGFNSWFSENLPGDWEERMVTHISDPVWEAPDATKGEVNKLSQAFEAAFKNFRIPYRVANEHAWLEIACAGDIYSKLGFTTKPDSIMVGPQLDKNHSIDEFLHTDSIATVIETIVYVLDNAGSVIPK